MWQARRDKREFARLLRGRPNFSVRFSKSRTATSLWDYAEDHLADRALDMSDEDLKSIQAIAAHYEDLSYPLPVSGQNISHNHVIALAAITYFEGRVRPLSQNRRRPEKHRPEQFTPVPPDPSTGL